MQKTYRIRSTDPTSAHARSDWSVRLHRPAIGWDVRIATGSEITADYGDFRTVDTVVCHDGDEAVFRRTWHHGIPRTAG